MNPKPTFREWVERELDLTGDQIDHIHLEAALELLVSRFELARRRGAKDPLATSATTRAGGNSRLCTKRMLEQLGYMPAERRAVQRLLVGTTSGWPGLLRLYAAGRHLTASDRQYARRQVAVLTRRYRSHSRKTESRPTRRPSQTDRIGSRHGCVASAATP